MRDNSIPIHKITVPITSDELILSCRGDFHYGVEGVNLCEGKKILLEEQEQHRNNQFIIYTGDLIENNLVNSVGHGYDIVVRDPHVQKETIKEMLTDLSKDLYGESTFNSNSKKKFSYLAAGVIGNHEYRSRKTSGQWLQQEMYNPAKILDIGINGILELTITNKKLQLSKTYRIYVSHSPISSNGTSIEGILRACKRKKADIPADIYVYGHYHRRLIQSDIAYDENGKCKKVLYVVNPSPMCYAEYADWAGYSPLSAGWYVNVRLPIHPRLYSWGKV